MVLCFSKLLAVILVMELSTSLRFSTKGTDANPVHERMIISVNGNVGIGTDSPLNDLYMKQILQSVHFHRK